MTYKENITAILECYFTGFKKEIIDSACNRILEQEPRKGYLSIDDVISVFDDFMCGEVDEDGTNIFLEMLKDKAEVRDKYGR